MKPVIGLTSDAGPARWATWQAPAALLPYSYIRQVAAAGGVPLLLPPARGIAAAVGRLDAVVLTGGGDIDPAAYGAAPHPRTCRVSAERDRAELGLLTAALAAGLPVLGICRGLQLLNVARGGTLHQHLPGPGPGQDRGHAGGPGTFGSHPVRVAAGSTLAGILGAGQPFTVPTAHHQAIDRLGDGLTATAWSADGVIEAAEMTGAGHQPWVVAVQWHPEEGDDPRLFQALVRVARSARAGRGPRGAREPRGRSGEGEQQEGYARGAEQGERR